MELTFGMLHAKSGIWALPVQARAKRVARPAAYEDLFSANWRRFAASRMTNFLVEYFGMDSRRLATYLMDDDRRIRLETCLTVTRLEESARELLPEVQCLLGDPNRDVRRAAFLVYQRLGDESGGVRLMVEQLRSGDCTNQFFAAAALRSFHSTLVSVLDELFDILVNDEFTSYVQNAASTALSIAAYSSALNAERMIDAAFRRMLKGKQKKGMFLCSDAMAIEFVVPLVTRLAECHPERGILKRCEREFALMLLATPSEELQIRICEALEKLKRRFDKKD